MRSCVEGTVYACCWSPSGQIATSVFLADIEYKLCIVLVLVDLVSLWAVFKLVRGLVFQLMGEWSVVAQIGVLQHLAAVLASLSHR